MERPELAGSDPISTGENKMESTIVERNGRYINLSESNASEGQDLRNVTQIEDGILQYVRQQMHCETVTQEVRRQAVAFEREMSRMSGW